MPKLETLAFCEKIIVDQRTDVASLIGLIDYFMVKVHPVPEDAVAPTAWSIYATHRLEPGESPDTEYEQKIELVKPDGLVALEMTTEPFRMAGSGYRQMYHSQNFPVGQAGKYEIKLSMREHGTPDWRFESSIKITVVHPKPAGDTQG